MDINSRLRLSRFLSAAEPVLDALALLAIAVFFIQFIPLSALSADPATGGDTGSHFWPLVTLVKHSLPEFSLRVWNPGNLGGEPQLVHYFPLPYFIMAVISIFVPLGTAFNIGTLLPLLSLPFSVYFGIRLFGWRFPTPILATCSSLLFLYNESFTMWGGNTLSTMAGQFAHLYALNFLLLALGFLAWELRSLRFPLCSSFLFAAVNLSHGYIMLGLPIFFLSFLFLLKREFLKPQLLIAFSSGLFAILLSAWFIIPMQSNSKWTIPHSFKWQSSNLMAEVIPAIFYPVILALVVSILLLLIYERNCDIRKLLLQSFFFWLLPILGYIGYYFLFPTMGLVDARAFPQIELLTCLLSAIFLGSLLRKNRIISSLLVVPLVCAFIFWVNSHVKIFPSWAKWNYSGWESKPAYRDLEKMYAHLRGDFSMPRVIYEHNQLSNLAGTERVFEMLPYFANRATMESVYLQASILAPAAFLLQAEVSKTPSCPFSQFKCAPYDLSAARERLRLLGVGELILITPELREQAQKNDFIEEDGKYGSWNLYRIKEQPALVEVFSRTPLLSSDPEWKKLFYNWLKNYNPSEPMIVLDRGEELTAMQSLRAGDFSADSVWNAGSGCKPELKVEFNRMHLKTNCPGKAHYLKFAYHETWKTDSGDEPFLVSPGFIGLIPSREEVTLTFGVSTIWSLAAMISIAALLIVTLLASLLRGRRFKTYAEKYFS